MNDHENKGNGIQKMENSPKFVIQVVSQIWGNRHNDHHIKGHDAECQIINIHDCCLWEKRHGYVLDTELSGWIKQKAGAVD